jgi:2-keto-3-deoxy-L-rhamnonate aldolase RhmA
MGLTAFVGDEPHFVDALERVTEAAQHAGILLMRITFGEEMLKERLEQGYTVVGVAVDLSTIAYGMIADLKKARRRMRRDRRTQLSWTQLL